MLNSKSNIIIFIIFVLINYAFAKPSGEIAKIDSNVYKYFEINHINLKNINDRIYRIYIAVPRATPKAIAQENRNFTIPDSITFTPKNSKKILYLLDGNAFFPRFMNLITNDIETNFSNTNNLPLIIGIGHDSDLAFDRELRDIDYTPKVSQFVISDNERYTQLANNNYAKNEYKNSDIESFHYFIVHILQDYISKRYGVNSDRAAIFGHSFGGLYTLYNAFNYPCDFKLFISASPSISYKNGAIIPNHTPFLSHFKNRTLIITQGSLERSSHPYFSRENLYNLLRFENPQNDIRFYDFYGKTHGESVLDAFKLTIELMKFL